MDFSSLKDGFANCFSGIPCGRQPFCTLALLAIGRGARTGSSRRRASLQNDLPLGALSFSTGC